MPVASPTFVGHMTSSLPSFMPSLAKIVAALNQNVVKLETSGALTGLERQVIGMLHHLVFARDDAFYAQWLHNAEHSLGAFCSGGTTANLTALWASRNNTLRARDGFAGINQAGLVAALRHYGYAGLAIIVSERGHYSLRKAADILGIGRENLVPVGVDEDGGCASTCCARHCAIFNNATSGQWRLSVSPAPLRPARWTRSMPLPMWRRRSAATFTWTPRGEATLLSERERALCRDRARGFGRHRRAQAVLCADGRRHGAVPRSGVDAGHHPARKLHRAEGLGGPGAPYARRVPRLGGRHALCEPAPAWPQGLAKLIDTGIDNAKYFASLIEQQPDFELDSRPQLCILTYRYVPAPVRAALFSASPEKREQLLDALDALTINIQEMQRDAGRSFVSRTQLTSSQWGGRPIAVFRVVLANPDTTHEILQGLLEEQRELAMQSPMLPGLMAVVGGQ
jgi:glutamate decarboxylase